MNFQDKNNLMIGDYILINNKYIGIIYKIIWNSNGFIVKLDNNENYEDKTLTQYKLVDFENTKGFMLVTLNDEIAKIDFNNISKLLQLLGPNEINNITNKINLKYNNFIKQLNLKSTEPNNLDEFYINKQRDEFNKIHLSY